MLNTITLFLMKHSPESIEGYLLEYGIAGIFIIYLIHSNWKKGKLLDKKEGEIRTLQETIVTITKEYGEDQKTMTIEVLDSSNNWREIIREFLK